MVVYNNYTLKMWIAAFLSLDYWWISKMFIKYKSPEIRVKICLIKNVIEDIILFKVVFFLVHKLRYHYPFTVFN